MPREVVRNPWVKTFFLAKLPNARVLMYGYHDYREQKLFASPNRMIDHAANLPDDLTKDRGLPYVSREPTQPWLPVSLEGLLQGILPAIKSPSQGPSPAAYLTAWEPSMSSQQLFRSGSAKDRVGDCNVFIAKEAAYAGGFLSTRASDKMFTSVGQPPRTNWPGKLRLSNLTGAIGPRHPSLYRLQHSGPQ